ncbi:sialidase family protein [Nonomuraea diastatica]|uniref:Exo-alpha-sialidase n=1 Tax=Nonomuraea diastatica TaxID=1848329 RepID=A0A4R4WYZ3_9ACTN|nr:sialidase family protein [Nonomuraea diastatica]TDD22985.1 exo-alpha-sialidase [Nonomuraea diastatica]
MPSPARRRGIGGLLPLPAVVAATLLLTSASPAGAAVPLTEIGADAYANATSQHATQAGPDTFQWGSVIVTAHQSGRFFDGGATGIAFAASPDNGGTWTKGVLPGITTFGGGSHDRVSDPSVAYDARHRVWLIASLALSEQGGITGTAVLASRSADGGRTWDAPVTVTTAAEAGEAGDRSDHGGDGGGDLDKSWIVCDNTPSSPFYGHCHAAFDDHAAGNAITMARSSDGGLTWTVIATPENGLGGQPVVRPDGAVVVPYLSDKDEIRSIRSSDGGASWEPSVLVTAVRRHTVAGGLRAAPLPSAETDATGAVYVAWHDCRFQYQCSGNDIVLSRSATGEEWSHVMRATSDGGDHFIPGLGVDRASAGGTVRLALTYYRYPDAACTTATCRLTVGYTSSTNGGATWAAPEELHGAMPLDWFADTAQGRMAGDYISTSVVPGGAAHAAFTVAAPPSGGAFDVRTYTVTGGLPITGGGPAPISVEVATATGEEAPDPPATAR